MGEVVTKNKDGEILTQVNTPGDVIQRLARHHAPEALRTLLRIMRNTQVAATVRRGAANDILDRAYGKPAQAVRLQDADGNSVPIRTIEVVVSKAQELGPEDCIEGQILPDSALPALEPVSTPEVGASDFSETALEADE